MKYFTLKELTRSDTATKNKIDNTPTDNAVKNLTALVDKVLDPLREMYGKPIYISSGYRCPRLNKAVGGVAGSQHKTGQAADIQQVKKIIQDGEEVTVVDHEANRRVFKLIEENFDFDQLLWENGGRWIHVSYRADGKNRRQVKRLWKK
jgi:hypothetical protein